MNTATNENEDTILRDLFELGHQSKTLANQPALYFKGPFVCAYAGVIFKEHNLRQPMAITADREGLYQYIDKQNIRHGFQIVKNGLLILPLNGPDAGQKIFLERVTDTVICETEKFEQSPYDLTAPVKAARLNG